MLSTTTKQINAYGKRSKRVIDAPIGSETAKPTSSTLVRIFDDLPPPSSKSGMASRMKKRENKLPSPKAVGKQAKKKRISPISPFKKPNRVAQLVQEAHADARANTNSPARAPLSSFSVNIPASPAAMPSHKHKVPVKAIPIKLAKPKEVNMDIIILDDEGRTVGKERRVSRSGMTAKPAKVVPKAPSKPIVYMDSDCEEAPSHPVPPKRLQKRRPVVTSDSEPESDVQLLSSPPSPMAHKKPANQPTKQLQRLPTVEVLIPPAPYRIPSLNKGTQRPVATSKAPTKVFPVKAAPPKLQQASPPPKPKPAPAATRPLPAFQLPPSPILKARPLTPIRGRRKGLFDPPSPPSPSLSDCDLSLDFSELAIDDGSEAFSQVEQDIPKHLLPLLEECGQDQCGPHDFSSFIDTFPFDPILQTSHSNAFEDLVFRKIGEASYSEVFGIGDVVLKVIPLRDESKAAQSSSKPRMDLEEEGPPPSDAQDVRKEIIVTRAMGEVYGGFVKFLKTYIVKGRYPELLLQLWDEYDKSQGSESIRPDTFKLSQVYAIIVLPNGGPDLESYSFTHASKFGWRKACSIFWQVAKSLSHAEHLVSFEHRDLHWGQVLVKNVVKPKLKSIDLNGTKSRKRKLFMDDVNHGVQTTIIDLGLSRMDAGDGDNGNPVHWTPFDDEVFMGEGEYQYDVYRMMRAHVGKDWEGYHPLTNVMWLHYLSTKLIKAKGLKAPRKSKAQPEAPLPPAANEDFSEQDCYEALLDVEQWLGAFLSDTFASTQKITKGKSRRKTIARPQQGGLHGGPASAGEVVQYGVKKGWISATVLY